MLSHCSAAVVKASRCGFVGVSTYTSSMSNGSTSRPVATLNVASAKVVNAWTRM